MLPVDSVVGWAQPVEGTPQIPEEWVVCGGQVLDDPESLLDGSEIPDLNGGKRFLRGSGNSGGTGGRSSFGFESVAARAGGNNNIIATIDEQP